MTARDMIAGHASLWPSAGEQANYLEMINKLNMLARNRTSDNAGGLTPLAMVLMRLKRFSVSQANARKGLWIHDVVQLKNGYAVFAILKGEQAIIVTEPQPDLFPSDGLIAKLRLVEG